MTILYAFLLRLAFGLALGLAITSHRQVASGYFRNHLYVTLGLATLASLISLSLPGYPWWPALVAAMASYVGSVCWLYEKPTAGRAMLWVVVAFALLGACAPSWSAATQSVFDTPALSQLLHRIAPGTSGMLLGSTMAAMLLGHWYLNSPGMELAPLRRLLVFVMTAVVLQMIASGIGLAGEWNHLATITPFWLLMIVLRWSFGLVGVLVLTVMAWQTLKIPNTQSATGILYVAVIGTFVGELTAALLSAESLYPL